MMLLFPKGCRACCAATLFLAYSALSVAADAQPAAVPPTPVSSILQMFFGLGLVLLLIAGAAWVLKRFSNSQFGMSSDVKVVSAVAVGPKERVVLIDVGATRIVLGVAPGLVNKIMEMPRPEEAMKSSADAPPSFVDKLKEKLVMRGESR